MIFIGWTHEKAASYKYNAENLLPRKVVIVDESQQTQSNTSSDDVIFTHLMNVGPLSALFWSLPTPERNIQDFTSPLLHRLQLLTSLEEQSGVWQAFYSRVFKAL